MQAEAPGGLVQRMDHQRVVVLGNDDAWLILRAAAHPEKPLDPVDGQARQPQAENTTTVQRIGTHHISIP